MFELRLDSRHARHLIPVAVALMIAAPVLCGGAFAQDGATVMDEDYESIDSSYCADCHEASEHGSALA